MFFPVVVHVPFANTPGPLQKKGIRPVQDKKEIKHVKGVSCVDPCLSALLVQSGPSAVNNRSVGVGYTGFGSARKLANNIPRPVPRVRLGGKYEEIRTDYSAGFQL